MLISRALVKAFSEQLPSFICWTLDFGGSSRHHIRTSGIKSSIKHYFWGIRESIKRTCPEHYPLDPSREQCFSYHTFAAYVIYASFELLYARTKGICDYYYYSPTPVIRTPLGREVL